MYIKIMADKTRSVRRSEKRLAIAIRTGDVRTIELAVDFLNRQIALATADQIDNPRDRAIAIVAALRIR